MEEIGKMGRMGNEGEKRKVNDRGGGEGDGRDGEERGMEIGTKLLNLLAYEY